MKKTLAVLLLLAVVGCGENDQIQDARPNQDPEPGERNQQDEAEAIEVLKKLGASVTKRDSYYSGRRWGGGYSLICRAPIIDADLVHLKSISNLRELRFARESQITDAGLVQIAGLTELSCLSLHGTQITDDGLRYLKRLPKLQILSLDNTAISDAGLLHLKGMSRLERLDLSPQMIEEVFEHLFVKSNVTVDPYGPEITDTLLEHLVDLKSLASGEGSNAPPAGTLLERLQSLASLASLDASNPEVTDDLLEYLISLAGLKELSLPDQVTDAGLLHLAGMRSLEKLSFSKTQVTDAGLRHLKGLTNLQTLYLGNSRVTDAGVAKLQKALPNCRIHH